MRPSQSSTVADLAAPHEVFVQATLDIVVSGLLTPRSKRMPGRFLEKAVLGQPLRGPPLQPGAGRRRQAREALAQRLARDRVHAQPIAAFACDQQRRIARQTCQSFCRIRHPRHFPAQLGMQVVDDRDASQELRVVGVKIGEQCIDEVPVQCASCDPPSSRLRLWHRCCG